MPNAKLAGTDWWPGWRGAGVPSGGVNDQDGELSPGAVSTTGQGREGLDNVSHVEAAGQHGPDVLVVAVC